MWCQQALWYFSHLCHIESNPVSDRCQMKILLYHSEVNANGTLLMIFICHVGKQVLVLFKVDEQSLSAVMYHMHTNTVGGNASTWRMLAALDVFTQSLTICLQCLLELVVVRFTTECAIIDVSSFLCNKIQRLASIWSVCCQPLDSLLVLLYIESEIKTACQGIIYLYARCAFSFLVTSCSFCIECKSLIVVALYTNTYIHLYTNKIVVV